MTSEQFAQEIVALTDTLYRVSYSILRETCDREDAVQGCLEKAWKKRRALRDERYLKTWLVRILINECYNICRRRAKEAPAETSRARRPAGGGPGAARRADAVCRKKCARPSSSITWRGIPFRRSPRPCALRKGRSSPACGAAGKC